MRDTSLKPYLLWGTAILSLGFHNAFGAYLESAFGNAVVHDASAVYFNPASLGLLNNQELILGETFSSVLSQFNGSTTLNATGFKQTGSTHSRTFYSLPSAYFAMPITDRFRIGFGQIYTFYGISDFPFDSVLRYVQTYSYFSALDFMGVFSFKATDTVWIGGGLDLIFAKITLDSMVGFPPLPVPDVKSNNNANANGLGGHAGILYTPRLGTNIGLAYHTTVPLNLNGHSNFDSNPPVSSNTFKVRVVTPSSVLFSVEQFLNKDLGIIGTLSRMNWDIVRNLNLKNVAISRFGQPVIIPSSNQPYFLKNTWRFTLLGHYRLNDQFRIRGSGSYDQDPTNPTTIFSQGTNIILNLAGTYRVSKQLGLDLSYAHVFYRHQNLNITGRSTVQGRTAGGRDVLTGKIIYDFV